jgi:hypothetical protein
LRISIYIEFPFPAPLEAQNRKSENKKKTMKINKIVLSSFGAAAFLAQKYFSIEKYLKSHNLRNWKYS